jgi:hypothetical protein
LPGPQVVLAEEVDGQPVDGHVLRGRQQVHDEHEAEQQPHLVVHERGQQAGEHEERLEGDDPRAAPPEAGRPPAVDDGGPQELEHPRRGQRREQPHGGARGPLRAEQEGQRLVLEAERQPLGQVEGPEEEERPGADPRPRGQVVTPG